MDQLAAGGSDNRRPAPDLGIPRPPQVNQFSQAAFGSLMAHDLQKQLLAAYQEQQQFSGDISHAWRSNQNLQQPFVVNASRPENVASPNPDWSEAIDALEAFDSNFFSATAKLPSSNDDEMLWNRLSGSPRREQQRSGSGDSEDEEAIRNLESMGNSIFRNMTDFGDDEAEIIATNFTQTRYFVKPPYGSASGQRPPSRSAAVALFPIKKSEDVEDAGNAAAKVPDITGVTDVRTLEAMLLKTLRIGDSAARKDTDAVTHTGHTHTTRYDQQSVLPGAQHRPLDQPPDLTSPYTADVAFQQFPQRYADSASVYAAVQRMPHDRFRHDAPRQTFHDPTSAAAVSQNNAYYSGRPLGINAFSVAASSSAYNNAVPRHIMSGPGMSPQQMPHQPSRPINAVPHVSNMQRRMLSRSPNANVASGVRSNIEGGVFSPHGMAFQQQPQQRIHFPYSPSAAGPQHPMQQMRAAQMMPTDAARRAYFMHQQQQQLQQQRSPFLPPAPASSFANQQPQRSFPPPPPLPPVSGGARMSHPPPARGEVRTFTNSNLKLTLNHELTQSLPPSMADIQQQQYQQHQQHQQQQQAQAQAAANYHQQLQQFYQQHGLPKANSYVGGGYCRFYGWMTEYERNQVLTQKECQTKTNNPYIDDYYYFHWRMVYDRSGVPKPMLRQRNWVEDISNMVLPPKCGAMTAPSDWYTVQFRGSLGKISTLSVFAPRQMIDIEPDDIRIQCEQSENEAAAALHAKKPDFSRPVLTDKVQKSSGVVAETLVAEDEHVLWRARRRLMMKVENMYVSVLNLEDSCRRLRILAGRASAAASTAAGNTAPLPASPLAKNAAPVAAIAVDEVDAGPPAPAVATEGTGYAAVVLPTQIAQSGTAENAAANALLIATINQESAQFLRILTSCHNVDSSADDIPVPFGSGANNNETRMLFCILTLVKGRQWLVRLLFQLPQPYLDELTSFLLESLVCRRSEYRRVELLSPASASKTQETTDANDDERVKSKQKKEIADERFDPLVPSPLFQVRVGIVDAIVLVEKLTSSIGRLTLSSTAAASSTLAADTMTAGAVNGGPKSEGDAVAKGGGKAALTLATLLEGAHEEVAASQQDAVNDAATQPTSTTSAVLPIDLQEFIMDNLAQVEVEGSRSQADKEISLLKALADKNLPPTLHQLGDVSLGFILLAIILYHDKVVPSAADADGVADDDDEKEDIRQVARNWSPLARCDALVLLIALFSRDHSAAIKRAAQKAHVNAARHVQQVFRLLNDSELVGNEKHRAYIEELLRDYMQKTAAAEAAAAATQQQQQQEKLLASQVGAQSSGAVQQQQPKNYAARPNVAPAVPAATAAVPAIPTAKELFSPNANKQPVASPPLFSSTKPAVVVAAKPPPVQPKVALSKHSKQQSQTKIASSPLQSPQTVTASAAPVQQQQQQQPQTNDFLAEVIKRFL